MTKIRIVCYTYIVLFHEFRATYPRMWCKCTPISGCQTCWILQSGSTHGSTSFWTVRKQKNKHLIFYGEAITRWKGEKSHAGLGLFANLNSTPSVCRCVKTTSTVCKQMCEYHPHCTQTDVWLPPLPLCTNRYYLNTTPTIYANRYVEMGSKSRFISVMYLVKPRLVEQSTPLDNKRHFCEYNLARCDIFW